MEDGRKKHFQTEREWYARGDTLWNVRNPIRGLCFKEGPGEYNIYQSNIEYTSLFHICIGYRKPKENFASILTTRRSWVIHKIITFSEPIGEYDNKEDQISKVNEPL